MSDLVKRSDILNALIEKGQKSKRYKWGESWELNLTEIKEAIESVPSEEPERKIIYCKDCKFAHLTTKGSVKYCDVWFPEEKTYLRADDFCSSVEKRGE